jgi:hypothetical protein
MNEAKRKINGKSTFIGIDGKSEGVCKRREGVNRSSKPLETESRTISTNGGKRDKNERNLRRER